MDENESCPIRLAATGSIYILVAWSCNHFPFYFIHLLLDQVLIFFFGHVGRLFPVGFYCGLSIQIMLIGMIDGKMAQLNPKRGYVR